MRRVLSLVEDACSDVRHQVSGLRSYSARKATSEPRTREEVYEALRAADGGRVQERDNPDAGPRPDRSGWDSVDTKDRPQLDVLHVSPERREHILDGEPGGGGGHRHGVGQPGKTEFPDSWNDQKIMGNVLDVARRPDSTPVHQHWNDRWVCRAAVNMGS